MYEWETEQWYKTHAERWKALENQRWKFARPTLYSGLVGIKMSGGARGLDVHTFYTKMTTPEQVHLAILEKCELIAQSSERFEDI